MKLNPQDLEKIATVTLEHYDQRAARSAAARATAGSKSIAKLDCICMASFIHPPLGWMGICCVIQWFPLYSAGPGEKAIITPYLVSEKTLQTGPVPARNPGLTAGHYAGSGGAIPGGSWTSCASSVMPIMM